MGVQILGAPLIKKFGIEPIPMGYVIVGEGGTAAIVGKAIPVPYGKPELVAAHALAGNYLGMRFIYLEGGSGAINPVPPEMIRATKSVISGHLIVGGGIKTKEQAVTAAAAGADIIVTGNLVESAGSEQKVANIIRAIKNQNLIIPYLLQQNSSARELIFSVFMLESQNKPSAYWCL